MDGKEGRLRVAESQVPPLNRIVVAFDPNAKSAEDTNVWGIVCDVVDSDDHAYVFDDIFGTSLRTIGREEPLATAGDEVTSLIVG